MDNKTRNTIGKILKSIFVLLLILTNFTVFPNNKKNADEKVEAATYNGTSPIWADPVGSLTKDETGLVKVVPDNVQGEYGTLWTKQRIDFNENWDLKTQMLLGGDNGDMNGIQIVFQRYNNQRTLKSYQDEFNSVYAGGIYNHSPILLGTYGYPVAPDMVDGVQETRSKMLVLENDMSGLQNDVLDAFLKEIAIMKVLNAQQPQTWTSGGAKRMAVSGGSRFDWAGYKTVNASWVKDATGGTITFTNSAIGTISAHFSTAEIVELFGPKKTAYMGFTGSSVSQSLAGYRPGLWHVKDIQLNATFETLYNLEQDAVLKHGAENGAVVDATNPAHKGETIFVTETLKNTAGVAGNSVLINYLAKDFVNLRSGQVTEFKVNGVSTPYNATTGADLTLNAATPIVITYKVLVESANTFTDANGPQKIGYTGQVKNLSDTTEPIANKTYTGPTYNPAPTINANDQIVPLNSQNSNATYIANASVSVNDLDSEVQDLTISAVSTSVNTSKPGIYPITYTVADPDGKTASVTKNVVVTPNGNPDVDNNKPYIYAKDMVVLKGGTIDVMTDVFAYDRKDGDLTAAIQRPPVFRGPNGETSLNTGITGAWDVTYTVQDSDQNVTTKTVKLYVVDKVLGDIGITAKNFELDVTEVASLNDGIVVNKGQAHAYRISTGQEINIDSVTHSIVATPGVYDVTYTAANVSYTVKATVTDDNTVIDGDTFIYAKNFVSKVGVALTDDQVRSLSEVYAKKISTNTLIPFTTDTSELNTDVVGSYPITYTANGVTRTIRAIIVGNDNPTINGNEVLDAGNFSLRPAEVATINKTNAIEKANATAFTVNEGTPVTITAFDKMDLAEAVGSYDVKFSTAKPTHKTVKAHVTNNANPTITSAQVLDAVDFSVKLGENNITNAKAIELAKAKSWAIADNSTVNINNVVYLPKDGKTLTTTDKVGSYDVKFINASGAEITVKGHVTTGDDPVVTDRKSVV